MKIETRLFRESFILARAPREAQTPLDLRSPGPYEDGELGNEPTDSWKVLCVSQSLAMVLI